MKQRGKIGLVLVGLFLFIWAGVSEANFVSLKASPSLVQPGGKIIVEFSGAPGYKTDWIGMYSVGASSENYKEWHYLRGKINGQLTFTAPEKEGNYEFRLFVNWPKGDYKAIAVSNVVRVVKSVVSPGGYRGVFRLTTGELITGELLSFDGKVFRIKTKKGVIEKRREDIAGILFEARPSIKPIKLRSISQWASKARASSEYSSSSWSAQQATGEPNTSKCGDIKTAWAPKSNGSKPEWLELTFNIPVYATKLRVHETYNAGFIYKVEFVDIDGKIHPIWLGKDTTSCPGWFEMNVSQTPYLVKSVILHTQKKGWEEVDAVQLIGVAEEE